MSSLFKKIYQNLFFNPYRYVSKNSNIAIKPDTILLKSTRFRINKQNRISIGHNSMVGCSFIFESSQGEIEIGDNSFVNTGTEIISRNKVTIGNNVMISWGCTIYDHNSHSLNWIDRVDDLEKTIEAYKKNLDLLHGKNWQTVKSAPIIIEDKVWIGFGCSIFSGVTIGEGAIIGANTVIRDNVEPWSVMIGNPAIKIKDLNN